jgi:hypothetical protein
MFYISFVQSLLPHASTSAMSEGTILVQGLVPGFISVNKLKNNA